MNWKAYQEQTAELFQNLGCDAAVDAKVSGARAAHKVDVWVTFKKFGLEIKWVIECKYWNSAVTKEKVLALQAAISDIGADRGILISAAGFQSGAIRASKNTNITLTDLEELKNIAQDELIYSALHQIETKVVKLKYALHDLYSSTKLGPHSWTSKPRPGVDGNTVMRAIGTLAVLDFGFDQVRLAKPPYPVKFDNTGQRKIVAETLEEFVALAYEVISEAEVTLNSQPPNQG